MSAADREEARRLFEEGVRYSAQERWGEALEYFRRSAARLPRPSTLFNIAVAEVRLGRPTTALGSLRAYLRASENEPGENTRRDSARALLETVLETVAELRLVVSPSHTEVRVDGVPQAGEGPLRVVMLDPGLHRLTVSAPDYEPETFELSVLDGEQTAREVSLVPVPVPPSPPRLRVTSTVAEAVIRLDGAEVGQGTYVAEISPGDHRVEVQAAGYEPFVRTLTVEAGDQIDLQAALVPERRSVLSSPWLWVGAGTVVVAAVAVVAAIVLAGGEVDPYPGTTGVVLQGLSW
jgi:hypothetical protein